MDTSLIACYVIEGLHRQFHLASLIGERFWRFNTYSRRLSFGDDRQWQAQILGTESHETGTWLWAWANTATHLPPGLTKASFQMKRFGEEKNIPELTQPQLPLTADINGHVLSMIASGVCDADAYYRGPYDGGAVFLLIKDETFPRSKGLPLARLPTLFPQAISTFPILDHRLALTSYLEQYSIPYSSDGNAVVVKEGSETKLTATFDEQKRLTKLDARLAD